MPNIFQANGTVTITGGSVSFANGKLTVDGVEQDVQPVAGKIELIILGDVGSVKSDSTVTVTGNVRGDVHAGGTVNADCIGGSINAGGSVKCGRVGGSIKAGGSVRHA